MISDIAGLVLAGGRSSRMGGGDKTLLDLVGRPLIGHVMSRLRPQVSSIAISANGDPARFAGLGADILADTIPDHPGPLAGILAGLEWAAAIPGTSHMLSVAGDTPIFPENLVERLAATSPERIAVASSGGHRHPVFALWPVCLHKPLADFLDKGDTRRVMAFIESQGFDQVDFPMEARSTGTLDPFFNINTPDDLAEAARLVGETYR